MIYARTKCPVCGTTAGPWFADAIDGLICVACAAWAGVVYAAYIARTRFTVELPPQRWAPCPTPRDQRIQ